MKLKTVFIEIIFASFCFLYASESMALSFGSAITYKVLQQVAIADGAVQQVNANSQTASNTDIPDENWSMEYAHNLVLIPMDGLVVPIEIENPTLTLKHDDRGRIIFSEGQVRSVTRTELVKYEYKSGVVNSHRPTLFVSIGGFSLDSSTNRHAKWQTDLDAKLNNEMSHYQYKHFLVEWDSKLSIKTQVGDLAGVIKDFLGKRIDSWDVVLVGHSRGGIFVHDLTQELVGYSKIKNLHTFLLDPTASIWHSDKYPTYKYESSTATHYGNLYYDGNAFIDSVNMSLGTVSDINITGYNNYGRNNYLFSSTHKSFGENWIAASNYGFNTALTDIRARKDMGSFVPDGSSGLEIVIISADRNLDIDGNIEITDGNIQLWTDVSAGGISLVNLEAAIGKDGIDIAGATAVSYSRIIINNDQLAVSNSTLLDSYSASISGGNVSVNVNLVFVGGSASINSNETSIRLNIFGHQPSATVSTTSVLTGGMSNLLGLKW